MFKSKVTETQTGFGRQQAYTGRYFEHTTVRPRSGDGTQMAELSHAILAHSVGRSFQITSTITEYVYSSVERYMQELEQAFLQRVLRCGPLSNAYNATRDTVCRKLLMPVV